MGIFAGVVAAFLLSAGAIGQPAKPELQPVDFNTLDTNHDGKLSRREARADPDLSAQFDTLDVNHDGYLSLEEFQAWPRAKKTQEPEAGTAPGGSSGAQHLPPH